MIWKLYRRKDMWAIVLTLSIYLYVLQTFSGAQDVQYMHLGCYHMVAPGEAEDGLKYHYATLQLNTCATGCNKEGYPYISLQRGAHCLCASEYGKGGLTFKSDCSETCHSDQTFACGGKMSENVYYAVNTARQVSSERIEMLKTSTMSFHQARKSCVQSDGDLVTLQDTIQMKRLGQMVNQSEDSSPFWIGLSRTAWSANRRWSIPSMLGLDSSDRSVHWAAGHPVEENHCTLLDPVSLTWYSAPCHEYHPYICHQVPPPPTPPPVLITDPPSTTTVKSALEQEDPTWAANKFIILWIILPIFFMCYGGSCVAYTAYKAYRQCKKSRRKARRAAMVKSASSLNTGKQQVKPGTSEDRVPLTSFIEPVVVKTENEETGRQDPPAYTHVTALHGPPRKCSNRPKSKGGQKKPEPEPVNENNIDFMMMSISDIMYMRAMLGIDDQTRPKKKKKIIAA